MNTNPHHHLYNSHRWRKLRKQVLNEEPLCRMCQQIGRTMPSDTVDHIKEHHGDEALFWDRGNLQALCKMCHNSAKALKEKHGFASGCDDSGEPVDPDHPWRKT